MDETRLILHVKGTEDQTTELPKNVVRAGIAQGQISRSQLIWSTAHNAWKQVRELPHLWPSQKLAPAPQPRVTTAAFGTGPVPRIGSTGPIPRVAVTPAEGAPRVHVVKPTVAVERDYRVTEKKGFNPFKWMGIVMGLIVLAVIGVNYLLVDRSIVSNMSTTPFANVTVYAHLGAYVQPQMLVMHIPATRELTSANITSFLVALAHNTPQAPGTGDQFERVVLTSGWMGQYSISGLSWKELGEMGRDDENQRREFLMDQLAGASGQPLVIPNPALDDTAQQAARDKAWAAFVKNFTGS